VTVRVDELTRVEDKRDDVEPFGLADINAGDFIEVRGSDDASGAAAVIAALLERDDLPDPANPGADTELQGFVDSVAQPSLTILGVTVETGGGTVFRDGNDQAIGAAAFFAAVDNGSLVKARGFETSATVIVAEEVELEN
jgi:hypothetical protein